MKQFLLLVLLVVSSMAYSQDYTQNLIDYNDWINAGSAGQPLTCWAPGGPGYCGPLPAVGAFNNPSLINFSYGLTDIYQPIGIAQALSAAGSGIIVNGFNFSFTAKNGNGWDNGQLDYLTAYAEFYNNNNLAESYNYDLNYRFNWTNFNYSETFTNPYQINDLDQTPEYYLLKKKVKTIAGTIQTRTFAFGNAKRYGSGATFAGSRVQNDGVAYDLISSRLCPTAC